MQDVAGMVYNNTPSLLFRGYVTDTVQLNGPNGVTILALSNITYMYVAYSQDDRVCSFDSLGHIISCISGYMVDNDTSVPFSWPLDVCVLFDGRLIVSDLHRVMVVHWNMSLTHI